MESVAFKRTAVIAIICFFLSFVIYRNLRQATEAPPTDDSKRFEASNLQAKPAVRILTPGKMSWSLEEAMDAHARDRRNGYVEYVMLQLARNEKRVPEVLEKFPELRRGRPGANNENRHVELFNLFAGYHAVQESLQRDVMLENQMVKKDDNGAAPKEPRPPVPLAQLKGPTVKSHPWERMLAGKTPALSPLSRCVPADFYLAEFRSLSKLLDTLEANRDWLGYFFTQGEHNSTDSGTWQRIRTQLLLDDSTEQRAFYDQLVHQVAIAGSDPFLKEGSDVTMLFRYSNPAFPRGMDSAQERLKQGRDDLYVDKDSFLGIDYLSVTSTARNINVYVANVPNLHVRSNSLQGLRRVLAAIVGRDAKGESVVRLGDTAEFRYIRTLMPSGAAEEDGLIYLSDPFVRRLLGPRTKIVEARRLIGYNHLRMIANAAQLYRSQFGKAPKTLSDLEINQCVPGKFNVGALACPFGGKYTLSADGTQGISSVLGVTQFLTPCCELTVAEATADEAEAYEQFLKDYERYWRTYFDPIAIRLQIDAKRIRVETLVLPLMDNSIYTMLAESLGKTPEPLDALPVPRRNLFTMNLRLNREAFVRSFGKTARAEASAQVIRAIHVLSAQTAPFVVSHVASLVSLAVKGTFEDIEFFPDPRDNEFFKKSGVSPEKLAVFMDKGIGNQIGINYYDTQIMFDVNLSKFLGFLMREQAQIDFGALGANFDQSLMLIGQGFFVSSLVTPIYVAVPVKDAGVVDDFLNHLDSAALNFSAFRSEPGGFGEGWSMEFYRQNRLDAKVRTLDCNTGPFRYRLHWARIGDGLYLTNQAYVLDDLHAAFQRRQKTASPARGPVGQAMIRMRPENWKQALDGYKLGWAENNREACQHNLSLLSAAARAFSTTTPVSLHDPSHEERESRVLEQAAKMYGMECKCPDGGAYQLGSDGKTFRCTVHGTLDQPTLPSVLGTDGKTERLMREFKDLHATLTFLPEGLRAVVVIERK